MSSQRLARTLNHRARPGRGSWLGLAAVFALLLGWNLAETLLTCCSPVVRPPDLVEFLRSGGNALAGRNPYELEPVTRFGQETVNTNLNPPVSLFLFAPLARLDLTTATALSLGATILLYALTCTLLAREHRTLCTRNRIAWLLVLAAFWFTVSHGQVYGYLFALVAGAWLLLRRGQELAAGLLIGTAVALKPNLAAWPALLLLAGSWRPAVSAAGAAGLLWAAAAVVFGPSVYPAWLAAEHQVVPERLWWPINGSLVGVGTRLGDPLLGYGLAAACLLAGAGVVWRRRDRAQASAAGLSLAVAASPIAWSGYLLWLLPVLLSRPWSPLLRLAALLMLIPHGFLLGFAQFSPTWATIVGALCSAPALLVTLEVLAGRAHRPAERQSAPVPAFR